MHEAYLRLVDEETPRWQNRAHFFGVAAQLMRHILTDHARARLAAKRAVGARRVTPDIKIDFINDNHHVVIDDALNELATWDAQQSLLVELRFFGGPSIEENGGRDSGTLGTNQKSACRCP